MILKDILNLLNIKHSLNQDILQNKIIGVSNNSLNIKSNYIFVAKKGYTNNGHNFITQSLKQGAVVAFAQYGETLNIEDNLKYRVILVKDTKKITIELCKLIYNKLPNNILGITGTNGKTSIGFFCSQLLHDLKIESATIGTIGIFFNKKKRFENSLTTPDICDLYRILSIAKTEGIDYVMIEVSSEGISEGRVDSIPFSVAAFTNLTQDHLNYHKNMENYYIAKKRLFLEKLGPNSQAVVNVDDLYGERLKQECLEKGINVLDYGLKAKTLTLLDTKQKTNGYIFTIKFNNIIFTLDLNILGEFQIYNVLCSLLLLFASGLTDMKNIIKSVSKLQPAVGRIQLIKEYNFAKIFVDYAHTPSALQIAIQTLRKISTNKLIVIFGCGGNRDESKREIMGEVAAKYADIIYVTDDNPRFENPLKIREQIIKGIIKFNNVEYYNFDNRKDAIIQAILNLKAGDVLLVAGKGHEDYQVIRDKKIFFSDTKIIQSIN